MKGRRIKYYYVCRHPKERHRKIQTSDYNEASPVKQLEQEKIKRNMLQYRNLNNVMEPRDRSKNRVKLKSQMNRVNMLMSIGFFLLLFILLTGCSKPDPVDVNSDNIEQRVLIKVKEHLDRAVKRGLIKQYQLSPVHSPTESFRTIAQEHVSTGATLHPNLTYNIKYSEGTIFSSSEKECKAMAYSVVKDGKLYGSGVVISEALGRTWKKTWTIGDNTIDAGVNWPIWIGGFILFIFIIPMFFRFLGGMSASGRFGRGAFLEDMNNAQNGSVKAMVNVGLAYWRGDGVTRNLSEAEYWLSRANDLGDPNAYTMLQRMHSNPHNPI